MPESFLTSIAKLIWMILARRVVCQHRQVGSQIRAKARKSVCGFCVWIDCGHSAPEIACGRRIHPIKGVSRIGGMGEHFQYNQERCQIDWMFFESIETYTRNIFDRKYVSRAWKWQVSAAYSTKHSKPAKFEKRAHGNSECPAKTREVKKDTRWAQGQWRSLSSFKETKDPWNYGALDAGNGSTLLSQRRVDRFRCWRVLSPHQERGSRCPRIVQQSHGNSRARKRGKSGILQAYSGKRVGGKAKIDESAWLGFPSVWAQEQNFRPLLARLDEPRKARKNRGKIYLCGFVFKNYQ